MKFGALLTTLLLSFLVVMVPKASLADETFADQIFGDELSPDEIAADLDLPEFFEDSTMVEEDMLSPLSIDSINARSSLNITELWPIVIIVNKARRGTDAQTLRVYHHGKLVLNTLTSTGREEWEKSKSGRRYFSSTPVGWFNPTKLVRDYFSGTWKVPMPYSVFFNGGIAIHAAPAAYYKKLGTRASGGCVRLKHEEAKWLFELVRSEPRALVPVFKRSGSVVRNSQGGIAQRSGSATLVIVEE